jgi:DNA mismatch repair protein MutL
MSVTDSRLCFERHATSKNTIQKIYFIKYKGLEEKHLPLLLQIAHVEMKTKQDQESWVLKLLLRGVSVLKK